MAEARPDPSALPEAEAAPRSRWRPQLVWLVPLVAALIGGWLAVKSILDRGPVIDIVFKSAEGLEAGKTKVKYKDVDIGLVTAVSLSRDLRQVLASAELVKDFQPHLVEDTRFWLVKPRISGGSVSGLGTVLSGAYIGVDVGKSSRAQKTFAALEVPPVIQLDTPGREFVLRSADLGSLAMGSPVFFRRLQVGQVVGYQLDGNGRGVSLRLFVNAPYDRFVTDNSRFWNASGIDVKLGAGGIEVDTQSLASLLLGGVAFETPEESVALPGAAPDTPFELFADRARAMRNPERDVLKMVLLFDESLRGLETGAPVDFRGIAIGEVTAIRVELEPDSRRIVMPVEISLYPERLRLRSRDKDLPRLSGEARRRFSRRTGRQGPARPVALRQPAHRPALRRPGLLPPGDHGPDRLGQRAARTAHHGRQPGRAAGIPAAGRRPAGKSCRWSRSAPTCGRPCRPPAACCTGWTPRSLRRSWPPWARRARPWTPRRT
ncbi:MlaD family protein [Azotobacter vinelandii]